MTDPNVTFITSKDSDVLTVKYLKANEGSMVDAMVEAGYGNEFPIQANEYMFTDDKDRPGYRVFSMIVKRGDETLKSVLDSYGKFFKDIKLEPLHEPVLSPKASAAAQARLRAKGYDIGSP